MKIWIAAVALIFSAAAADARYLLPNNTCFILAAAPTDKGLEKQALAVVSIGVSGMAGNTLFNSPLKPLEATPLKSGAETDALNNQVQQDQNPVQNPANKEQEADAARNTPEVKVIPKARRVEKPAKVEGSAKRPAMGSAKRGGNAGAARPDNTAAKPSRSVNPNQNRPARAGRPTGGGRPDNSVRPNKGKGKD